MVAAPPSTLAQVFIIIVLGTSQGCGWDLDPQDLGEGTNAGHGVRSGDREDCRIEEEGELVCKNQRSADQLLVED